MRSSDKSLPLLENLSLLANNSKFLLPYTNYFNVRIIIFSLKGQLNSDITLISLYHQTRALIRAKSHLIRFFTM